jgi:hypothetical protein
LCHTKKNARKFLDKISENTLQQDGISKLYEVNAANKKT